MKMSLGPIAIFDKSFLESLSLDESTLFDNFFRTLITPLFYVETLADLEKSPKKGNQIRTPLEIVGEIAKKTPILGSVPNVHYERLLVPNLLGKYVEMRNRPFIAGGVTKRSPDSKVGIHFEEFPEEIALQRWRKGEFREIERGLAKQWRQALSNLTFDATVGIVKNIVPVGYKLKSLEEVKAFVDNFVAGNDIQILNLALELFGFNTRTKAEIISRWKTEAPKSFEEFAPYASYVFKIDLFFYLILHLNLDIKDLGLKKQASSKIDLAYLYYLPFGTVLISNDKLHEKVAPLFMEKDQVFVSGTDLKSDMKKLNEYYSQFAEEISKQGLFKFAAYPPTDIDTLTGQLWDKYLPAWRKHSSEKASGQTDREMPDDAMLEHMKGLKQATFEENLQSMNSDDADYVVFTRSVPVQKGKWRIMPEGIENQKKSKE